MLRGLKQGLVVAEEEIQQLQGEMLTLKKDMDKLREDDRQLDEELVARERGGKVEGHVKEVDYATRNTRVSETREDGSEGSTENVREVERT
jgi:hypothetical protein